MSQPPDPATYELVVPATGPHVATSRMFMIGVANVAGCDEDVVADVKLAVSEMVTAIVEDGAASEIRVTATISPGRLSIRIAPWPDHIDVEDLGVLDIVDVLFPGTAADDGAVVIPVDLGHDA